MKTEDKVYQHLRDQKKTVAIAESCTGGLLGHRLTNIPGSSAVFPLGITTYSNEAKMKLLKVKAETLTKHGAVSTETALEMAKGVRKILKSDFGVSITGIAGPDGGTKSKPVGLVFIAVSTSQEALCLKCQFEGTRSSIKMQSTTQALKLLFEFLE